MCREQASYYKCAIGCFNKWCAATFCLPWVVFLASPASVSPSDEITTWQEEGGANIVSCIPVFPYLPNCLIPPSYHFVMKSAPGWNQGEAKFAKKSSLTALNSRFWHYHFLVDIKFFLSTFTIGWYFVQHNRIFNVSASLKKVCFCAWTCRRNPFQPVFVTKTTPFVLRPNLICNWEDIEILLTRQRNPTSLPSWCQSQGWKLIVVCHKVAICRAHLSSFWQAWQES